MTLVPGERPSKNVIIGPVKRCGYVCLINGVEANKANCEVQTVLINDQIRIILFSSKIIVEGEELCYFYGEGSRFEKSTLTKEKLN